MPVFNGGLYIEAALISILNQTYKNFELIISDNASIDDTEAICRKYTALDNRITYIKQSANKGGLANFFTVLSHASGEYFMWAAADDTWDSNWAETLLRVCIENKCIAFGRVRQIDSNEKCIPYLTNNKKLSFTGFRYFRRIKFFFEPGTFGKANIIYAIFPREVLSPKSLDVLTLHFIHVDMLFVYNLLKGYEVRAGHNTFINKRIHNPADLERSNKLEAKKLLQYYKGYFSISSYCERGLLVCFFIPAIIYDVLVRLYSRFFILSKANI